MNQERVDSTRLVAKSSSLVVVVSATERSLAMVMFRNIRMTVTEASGITKATK